MNQLPLTIDVTLTTGKGRGKKMGIPTLNFEIPPNLELKHGIYAGWLIVGSQRFKAAIHYGPRPVFEETDPSLEAYLLEGTEIQHEKPMKIAFQAFIREILHFPTPAALVKQIAVDVEQIKQALNPSGLN